MLPQLCQEPQDFGLSSSLLTGISIHCQISAPFWDLTRFWHSTHLTVYWLNLNRGCYVISVFVSVYRNALQSFTQRFPSWCLQLPIPSESNFEIFTVPKIRPHHTGPFKLLIFPSLGLCHSTSKASSKSYHNSLNKISFLKQPVSLNSISIRGTLHGLPERDGQLPRLRRRWRHQAGGGAAR